MSARPPQMTQERPAMESERARPKLPKVISSSWLIMFCVFIGKKLIEKSHLVNRFSRKKSKKNRTKKLDKDLEGIVQWGIPKGYPPPPPGGGGGSKSRASAAIYKQQKTPLLLTAGLLYYLFHLLHHFYCIFITFPIINSCSSQTFQEALIFLQLFVFFFRYCNSFFHIIYYLPIVIQALTAARVPAVILCLVQIAPSAIPALVSTYTAERSRLTVAARVIGV